MSDVFMEQGLSDEEIFSQLDAMTADDIPNDGSAFAFVYDAGKEAKEVARRAFAKCMTGNGLDPTAYPSARRLENDVVAAALSHLRAPEGAVGTATAGGTESVVLSVKAARDYARKTRPEVTAPEMLVPETAHACFHKGAHYLGVKLVPVAVDPNTMRPSVEDMRAKINANTILLVASAPSYAHGVIDPIEEVGALALEHDLLFHVDACIGGWVLPFQRELGIEQPEFDFTVPGVTSISVDLHKYAFAPKGISVLAHRKPELRDAQYFTCAHWTGYSVINTTTLGSKSLASLAAAWAVLRHLGRAGYREIFGRMYEAKKQLVEGVEAIDGLHVVGNPAMGLIAVVADKDLFTLADRMTAKGWHLQPTYKFGSSPTHIHFGIDASNTHRVGALLADLREAAVDLPDPIEAPEPVVQMIEMMAQGAGGDLDAGMMMRELGIVDGKLPAEQAMIHRLLDAASPKAREALLVKFFGELFS